FPPAKPRFSPSVTSFTHGKRDRTYSVVPSVDPLSTTIVSVATPACAATLDKQVSRCCRPFHVTMTIETSGCTNGLAIDVEGNPGRSLPGVRAGSREPSRPQVVAQRFVVHHANDRVTPCGDVARI